MQLNLGANTLCTTCEPAGGGLAFKKLRFAATDPAASLGGDEGVHDLPESLLGLQAKLLGFRYNRITELPDSFGALRSLEQFSAVNNKLSRLAESFGDLSALRELNLRANRIEALPATFDRLTSLERLDLRDNLLARQPPGLPKLTKVRLDGNPVMKATRTQRAEARVPVA